jgi:hypothetical protein
MRQLDNLDHPFRRVVQSHLKKGICFFDRQPRLLGSFKRRIRRFGLSIHLETELTAFRPFALPELLRRGLFGVGR